MHTLRFATLTYRLAFCALLACSALPALATAELTQQAEAANNKASVAAAFERWAAGGSDFFNEVVAPDVVWTIQGAGPNTGTYHGRQDLLERAVRPLTSRLKTPIRPVSKRLWADGDHVIVSWEGQATARDAKPYTNSYVWIMRMENGRAAEVTAYLDMTAYNDVLRRIAQPN